MNSLTSVKFRIHIFVRLISDNLGKHTYNKLNIIRLFEDTFSNNKKDNDIATVEDNSEHKQATGPTVQNSRLEHLIMYY